MNALRRFFLGAHNLIADEDGSTMAEFALVLVFFTMAAWGTIAVIGSNANSQLNQSVTNFSCVTTDNIPSGYTTNGYE